MGKHVDGIDVSLTQQQQCGGGNKLHAQVDAFALAATDAPCFPVPHQLTPYIFQLQHLQ